MINKDRMLAITDGIVAIAATIMVLELAVPDEVTAAAIEERWPILLAYVISFTQIFLAWHEHHDSLALAKRINHRVFLLNCLWLFFITLLPFTTGIVGRSPNHTSSVLLYIAVLFAQQLAITIESVAVRRLNGTPLLDAEVIKPLRIITLIAYVIAAIGTVFLPISGLIIILALSLGSIIAICVYDRKLYLR